MAAGRSEAGGLVDGENQRQGSAPLDSVHQWVATLADRGDEDLHDKRVPEGADAGPRLWHHDQASKGGP